MNKIIPPTTDTTLQDTRARLDALRAEIDELVERRKNLVTTTTAELAAAGIETVVIRTHKSTWQQFEHWQVGEQASIYTCIDAEGAREVSHHASRKPWKKENPPLVSSPNNGWMFVQRGRFEVVLVDEPPTEGPVDSVWAKIEDPSEDAHRRAISNLRGRARREGYRVQARDRAVSLIDPMNTVVHEGDVITASMWLVGIDAEAVGW